MRRPEAVGGALRRPAAAAPSPRSRVAAPPVERPARPAPPAQAGSTPARPAPPHEERAPKPPRASRRPAPARERVASADIRAAARARRREEKREVKRFTRRARHRRAGLFAAGGVLVLLVLLVLTAVYSPLLALRTIRVDGTHRLDASALETALAPNLGTPLALLDDSAIKKELGRYSLIRSYVTELEPPATLIVHVSERTPVGVIQGADDFQLVDPAGIVVDRTAKRPDGVPLIQLADAPLNGPGFASMAQVLLALPAALRAQVDTIAARTHDDVTLTLRGSGQRVLWGSADQSVLKAQVLGRLIALHGQKGSGTYTVSAPQFAVFNPSDTATLGGVTPPSTEAGAGGTPTPTGSPTAPAGGDDQGGVQG